MKRTKSILPLMALMLCMGALFFTTPAYASADPEPDKLTVSTAWTDGDLLHVEVRNNDTGAVSGIELRLSDYAGNAQTITIQAVDADGNKSGVITIINPNYIPPATEDDTDSEPAPADTAPSDSESAVPDGSNPFTPDGTGGVVDNATELEGKEFFTITTEAGNEFFLIVDRQKAGENVYLLNAVTENDLMALAKKGDGTTESAVPDSEPAPTTPTPEPSPEPAPEPQNSGGNGNGSLILIILAVVVVGGVGYYFKIYKPKKQSTEPDEDYSDDYDDDSGEPDDYGEEDTE